MLMPNYHKCTLIILKLQKLPKLKLNTLGSIHKLINNLHRQDQFSTASNSTCNLCGNTISYEKSNLWQHKLFHIKLFAV